MDTDRSVKESDSGKASVGSRWTEEGLNELSGVIIGCAFTAANALGPGFLEKVYENALAHELRKHNLRVEQQKPISVMYDGIVVGEFFADILVEEVAILELKVAREHNEVYIAQCLNYLKATGLPLCLLLNFGTPRLEIKRLRGPTNHSP
jgi:GxxExxY protein